MQVQNLQMIANLNFEQYLALPGYSYSGIKGDGNPFGPPTEKMQLGTLVHSYLLTPALYDHTNNRAAQVKALAIALKTALGTLYSHLLTELSLLARFVYAGFSLPYKGRLDLGIPGVVVVDLKISELETKKSIELFGYNYQTSGYAIAIGAPVILLAACNPKTHKVTIEQMEVNYEFWQYHVKQKGEPLL